MVGTVDAVVAGAVGTTARDVTVRSAGGIWKPSGFSLGRAAAKPPTTINVSATAIPPVRADFFTSRLRLSPRDAR